MQEASSLRARALPLQRDGTWQLWLSWCRDFGRSRDAALPRSCGQGREREWFVSISRDVVRRWNRDRFDSRACSNPSRRPTMRLDNHGRDIRVGAAVWTVQILLALIFVFAGGMKLIIPIAELAKQGPFPG